MQVHAQPAAEGQDPDTQQRAPWLAGVFAGSSKALREGLESLCSFIGIKVRLVPCSDEQYLQELCPGHCHGSIETNSWLTAAEARC